MRYKTVKYGYVKNNNNYENERIFVEAEIEEGESYENVLEKLKQDVHSQLNDYDDYYRKESEMRSLKNQIAELTELREKAKAQYEATKLFLETQGIKVGMPPFPEHNNLLMPSETIEAKNVDDINF